jgi:hypothetical protein
MQVSTFRFERSYVRSIALYVCQILWNVIDINNIQKKVAFDIGTLPRAYNII